MKNLTFGPLTAVSLVQSLQDQFLGHPLISVPAYDFARVQVHDARDIEPSFVCRNVRDVRHPDLVGSLRCELLVQHIVMHRQVVPRVRRRLVFSDGARLKPQLLHDAGDGFLGNSLALLAQDLSDLRTAIQTARFQEDAANLLFQLFAAFFPFTFLAPGPLIITAPGYIQNPAHLRHRIHGAVLVFLESHSPSQVGEFVSACRGRSFPPFSDCRCREKR